MLPEINISNTTFKIFQSSVVGSMQEAELKRKKEKDTRLKNVKQTEDKDQYSGDLKDVPEDEKVFAKDDPDTKDEKSKKKRVSFSSKKYAANAYELQQKPEHSEDLANRNPIVEI